MIQSVWCLSSPHPHIMNPLSSQDQIPDATEAQLRCTVSVYTGELAPESCSMGALRRLAEHAIMLAQEDRNHRGVPKDTLPPLLAYARMVEDLAAERAPDTPKGGWRTTGFGRTRLQPASLRCAVYNWIGAHPGITSEELERHFGRPCAGFLQKLLEQHHLERT